jgi:hypothetical protein
MLLHSLQVWKAIPFEFTVQNLSNAPLVCKLNKLPLEVTIDSPALQKDDKEKEINKKYATRRERA